MFDILIAIYLLVNILLGFRYGLFRRLLHFLGFFLGLFLAQNLSPGIATQLGYNTGDTPAAAHFAVYMVIAVFVMVAVEILSAAFGDALGFITALVFDRFAGVVAGVAASAFEVTIVLYLFANLLTTPVPSGTGQPHVVTTLAAQVDDSVLAKLSKLLRPAATFVYLPVLPPEPSHYFAKTYT